MEADGEQPDPERTPAAAKSAGGDDTRRRVLDVARRLFADRGYRATSMRQIAEQVGISKAALYYHFAGKDEILSHLTEPLLDDWETVLARAEEHPDPDAVRWQALEALLDVFLRHRKTLLMLVRDMTLLVQAPVAPRVRAAMALANDLVAGPDRSLQRRVRAAQAVAGLGDVVVLFSDAPEAELRRHVMDGVRVLLATPSEQPTAAPVPGDHVRRARGRPRGRTGGRPPALDQQQIAQAREMYQSGGRTVDDIAAAFGVSRATIYRHLKTT
jgi:AcrR family transcriptional regulator